MALSEKLLEEMKARREKIFVGGGEDKIEARRKKGLWSARERLDALFEEDTFQESGVYVRHSCHFFGMESKELPGDAVVVGTGFVDGRQVASFSQDFTVAAGSLGKMHAKKIVGVMDSAAKLGIPLVAFKDSGGARIQEGVDSLSGYGDVFYRNVILSGVVPQIAVICGPCAGGAAYSPALMDFIIMTKTNAYMFITGPEVIKAVTGKAVTMDEVGSAAMHSSVSGNVHFVAEDEAHAVSLVHQLLSYLPSNNSQDPPHRPSTDLAIIEDATLNELIPDDSSMPMDVHGIIAKLVDDGEFLEVHANFARNIVVGFARIEGIVVGVVANQPSIKAGTLDIDSSDKGARFIRTCNAFNVPLLTLVDIPGFMPGIEQERGGIIRHGAKMLFAYSASTVPKVTVILRKAYGGAYLAMCGKDMGADRVIAWPTAEIAVMGAEGAAEIVFRKEIEHAEDKPAKRREMIELYRESFANPYVAASRGLVDDIIEPADTRKYLALALESLHAKREARPPKKHGLIPL